MAGRLQDQAAGVGLPQGAITRMAGEEGIMGKRLGILGAVIAVMALVGGMT